MDALPQQCCQKSLFQFIACPACLLPLPAVPALQPLLPVPLSPALHALTACYASCARLLIMAAYLLPALHVNSTGTAG